MSQESSSLEPPVQCTEEGGGTGQVACPLQPGPLERKEDVDGASLTHNVLDARQQQSRLDETKQVLEMVHKCCDDVAEQGRREIKLCQLINGNTEQILRCNEKFETEMARKSEEVEGLKAEMARLSNRVDHLETENDELKRQVRVQADGMVKKQDMEEKLADMKKEMDEVLRKKDDQMRQLEEQITSFTKDVEQKLKSTGGNGSGGPREGGIQVNPVINVPVLLNGPMRKVVMDEMTENINGAPSAHSDSHYQSRSDEFLESGFADSSFSRSMSEPSIRAQGVRGQRGKRGQKRRRKDCVVM